MIRWIKNKRSTLLAIRQLACFFAFHIRSWLPYLMIYTDIILCGVKFVHLNYSAYYRDKG